MNRRYELPSLVADAVDQRAQAEAEGHDVEDGLGQCRQKLGLTWSGRPRVPLQTRKDRSDTFRRISRICSSRSAPRSASRKRPPASRAGSTVLIREPLVEEPLHVVRLQGIEVEPSLISSRRPSSRAGTGRTSRVVPRLHHGASTSRSTTLRRPLEEDQRRRPSRSPVAELRGLAPCSAW